jgi:hypothetical protein
LVLSASSLSLLGLALASHQVQAADHHRRQADDGLRDLAQLLAHQLVGRRPEQLNPASLCPDLLAMALPAGWQLGRLQWQPSEPADPGLVTLQVVAICSGRSRRCLQGFGGRPSIPDWRCSFLCWVCRFWGRAWSSG